MGVRDVYTIIDKQIPVKKNKNNKVFDWWDSGNKKIKV
jgi:hypothetical protein